MAENRLNRELDTRAVQIRKQAWTRPDTLPSPNPEPGYTFRWVRVSMRDRDDPSNVSMKLREGWEPVKATDHPEIYLASVENDSFKDNVVIGGLMLCKAPDEMVTERNTYFNRVAASQMSAVDQSLMRENDPRMPLFNNRESTVKFGSGRGIG